MPNFLNFSMSRRSLIKFGAASGALLTVPFWGSNAISQSIAGNPAKAETKPDGLVSFNAGWVILVEDKPALLLLEQKKIKEAQSATSQAASPGAAGSENLAKPANKSWKDKVQDAWSKVKGFF